MSAKQKERTIVEEITQAIKKEMVFKNSIFQLDFGKK